MALRSCARSVHTAVVVSRGDAITATVLYTTNRFNLCFTFTNFFSTKISSDGRHLRFWSKSGSTMSTKLFCMAYSIFFLRNLPEKYVLGTFFLKFSVCYSHKYIKYKEWWKKIIFGPIKYNACVGLYCARCMQHKRWNCTG